MQRRKLIDAALAAVLLPLWLTAFTLHVRQVARGRLAWVGVFVVSAERDVFPTVTGLWPGDGAQHSSLEVGDRLLRLGDADLRGVGPVGFFALAHEQLARERPEPAVPVVYEHAGERRQTYLPFVPLGVPWRMIPLTSAFVLTGALVLLRRPGVPVARAFFLSAIAFSLHWTLFFGGRREVTYAWALVFAASSTVMLPLMLRTAAMFPDEAAPEGGPSRWTWVWALYGPIVTSAFFGAPLPAAIGLRGLFLANAAFILAVFYVLTGNFLRAGPIGRRQLKWAVYGIYLGLAPVLAANVITAVQPGWWWLHDVATTAEALIPIGIFIAIARFNLYDIDRLITVTAVYSVLSVVLLGALLTVIPPVAAAATQTLGMDEGTGRLGLSVALAALLVPAERRLRPRVERLFFAERYALERGIERLLREISACPDAEALLTLTGEWLSKLLRPASCLIYAPTRTELAPVFAHGPMRLSTAPPSLELSGPIIQALRGRNTPLRIEDWRRAPRAARLAVDDVLDRLAPAVLLPVSRGEMLVAMVSLGSKRSGDVYTSSDLALLGAVADKVSGELLRFDEAEVLRQARAMQDALRRYVPGAVAEAIVRGQEPEGGVREISVLFVDIRGFTTFSEHHVATTVFSVVSRYAEAASEVIRAHGGTVVEFLGDGLMAVFGAPASLPDHARAAVGAGRGIIASVHALALRGTEPGSGPVAVGVGIATGPAFVGNVETADRVIYTALGDTVNLASRLQGLTRDLGAAVAIDAATHAGAGATASDFASADRIPIRGRQGQVDVYILPLGAFTAAATADPRSI